MYLSTLKNCFVFYFTKSPVFLSLFVFTYSFINVLFAEKISANAGLGWDGCNYAALTKDFIDSAVINDYLSLRVFIPFSIHIFFKIFNVAFLNSNIINAFEIINLVFLSMSAYFTILIFEKLSFSNNKRILALILLFVTFSTLKFNFYYPVMIDTTAFLLSLVVLYCYLFQQHFNLILLSVISFFTWPILSVMAIILFVFPLQNSYTFPEKTIDTKRFVIPTLTLLYGVSIAIISVYFLKIRPAMLFTAPFNEFWFPLSLLFYSISFFAFGKLICLQQVQSMLNKKLFYIKRILFCLVLFLFFIFIANSINKNGIKSENLGVFDVISLGAIYGNVLPAKFIISHFCYFGCAIVFLVLFWNKFAKSAIKFGFAIAVILYINFLLWGTISESRRLIHIFPVVVFVLVDAFDEKKISAFFLFLVFILNVILSKLWLPIKTNISLFLLNLGPWMFDDVYLIFLTAFLFISLFLAYFLFRKNTNNGKLF